MGCRFGGSQGGPIPIDLLEGPIGVHPVRIEPTNSPWSIKFKSWICLCSRLQGTMNLLLYKVTCSWRSSLAVKAIRLSLYNKTLCILQLPILKSSASKVLETHSAFKRKDTAIYHNWSYYLDHHLTKKKFS